MDKFRNKNFVQTWSCAILHMCNAQETWNPDQIAEYRLNFSVLFGVMRQKLYQVLISTKKLSSPF